MALRHVVGGGLAIGFAAGLVVLSPTPASAQTLTLAVAAAPTSVDPNYHNFAPNNSLARHVFGKLIDTDERSRIKPALALSWRLLDDTSWEFKLRPGVTFHDGSGFGAEDVAYTIARIPTVKNSPGSFLLFTRSITEVQVVDTLTVRFKTRAITPQLPIDMGQVFMLPRGLGPEPGIEGFNALQSANGTGAFRITAYRAGDVAELTRNDAFWGQAPHWQRVVYRMIPNDGGRIAALLAGDVDFVEAVPTSDVERLRGDNRVALAEAISLRFAYIALDRSRAGGPSPFVTGPNGDALGSNPLDDVRVRRALSIAINRPAIVARVMEGAAVASGQLLAEGSVSYVPDLPVPALDAAQARRLLAEAGFPNGLRITLHGPNDRYVNDEKVIQAIGQMWSRIGVQTKVEAITWPSFIARAARQDFSAFFAAWGTTTGEASNPLRALLATFDASKGFGSANRTRYSNPDLDALIQRAISTADDAARERVLQDATRLAMSDVGLIPLYLQKNIWGMKPHLRYLARADEATHAMDVMAVR